jgi:hypothetical protein
MKIFCWSFEDDGKGFCESEVVGSLGVLGMKERAAAWGGACRCRVLPARGRRSLFAYLCMMQASSGRIMHILIADDHAVVRRGVKEILAEALPGARFSEAGQRG